jgi:hypothetical protein
MHLTDFQCDFITHGGSPWFGGGIIMMVDYGINRASLVGFRLQHAP